MTTHEWHDRDDDDVLRYVRARLFGGRWTLHARSEDAFLSWLIPQIPIPRQPSS